VKYRQIIHQVIDPITTQEICGRIIQKM